MKKKRRTKKVAFSIRSKLLLLLSASMLPFLLIAVYLLISIANYNQTYHEIVDHLTIANTYNIQFKEQMDESLYKVVVGYVSMDNIANDETLKDPYVLIRNLKKSCTGLRDVTSDYESRMWLDSLLRNVDTLKNRVDDIAENVKKGDRYDENIRQLDDNIYILTELIQEDIQYYIYLSDKLHGGCDKHLKPADPHICYCVCCSSCGTGDCCRRRRFFCYVRNITPAETALQCDRRDFGREILLCGHT